jgi:hypothetical protein
VSRPLPLENQCRKCKQWFHTVHVCAADIERQLPKQRIVWADGETVDYELPALFEAVAQWLEARAKAAHGFAGTGESWLNSAASDFRQHTRAMLAPYYRGEPVAGAPEPDQPSVLGESGELAPTGDKG